MNYLFVIILVVVSTSLWFYLMIILPKKHLQRFKQALMQRGYSIVPKEAKSTILAQRSINGVKCSVSTISFLQRSTGISSPRRCFIFRADLSIPCSECGILRQPFIASPAVYESQKLHLKMLFDKEFSEHSAFNNLNIYYHHDSPPDNFTTSVLSIVALSLKTLVCLSKNGFYKAELTHIHSKQSIDFILQAEEELKQIQGLIAKSKSQRI